jgi:hypothetical protein
MTPEVEGAIKELERAFPGSRVDVEPDADGGAWVVVNDLPVGPTYELGTTWVGFQVTFQYPRADVYPHFLDGALRRKDGKGLGEGFSGATQWRGRPAVQVSRRSNRLDPSTDTAATKLAKVLEWVRTK